MLPNRATHHIFCFNLDYENNKVSESLNSMVRLGLVFLNLARRKRVGLQTRKSYISPENNAGIWHGAGVKSGHKETFSGKK